MKLNADHAEAPLNVAIAQIYQAIAGIATHVTKSGERGYLDEIKRLLEAEWLLQQVLDYLRREERQQY